jgi:DNA-binding transcriptional MerR regulator
VTGEVGFHGPQVCRIVGITYRQLDYWARTDLIRPSIATARGSGTRRLFSYNDLVELMVVKRLLDAGVELRSARRAVHYLRSDLGDDIASAQMVIADGVAHVARTGGEVLDLLRHDGGLSIVLSLGGVTDALTTAIETERVREERRATRRSA